MGVSAGVGAGVAAGAGVARRFLPGIAPRPSSPFEVLEMNSRLVVI
jgi:hypothetical protein